MESMEKYITKKFLIQCHEKYEDMLVFGENNPRPKDAVKPNTKLP